MSSDERRRLRDAVSEAKRALWVADVGEHACRGCGRDSREDEYTPACKPCGWRRWSRQKRGRPGTRRQSEALS